jgi:hypothetical protein
MLFISFAHAASLARKMVVGSAVRCVRSFESGMYAMVPSMIWVHSCRSGSTCVSSGVDERIAHRFRGTIPAKARAVSPVLSQKATCRSRLPVIIILLEVHMEHLTVYPTTPTTRRVRTHPASAPRFS